MPFDVDKERELFTLDEEQRADRRFRGYLIRTERERVRGGPFDPYLKLVFERRLRRIDCQLAERAMRIRSLSERPPAPPSAA